MTIEPQSHEYLSCQQVRSVDQFAIKTVGIEGLVLMENAARGSVDLLLRQPTQGAVVVVCGPGNNGGDGLAMVRHLMIRGVAVKALLAGDPTRFQGDALRNFQILNRIAPQSIELAKSNSQEVAGQLNDVARQTTKWIVDSLLGTGMQGEIREPFGTVIEEINASNAKVYSVDIPSGLHGDTGAPLGATVRANVTGTFVCKKKGFQFATARPFLGEVSVLDIGVPDGLIREAILSASGDG